MWLAVTFWCLTTCFSHQKSLCVCSGSYLTSSDQFLWAIWEAIFWTIVLSKVINKTWLEFTPWASLSFNGIGDHKGTQSRLHSFAWTLQRSEALIPSRTLVPFFSSANLDKFGWVPPSSWISQLLANDPEFYSVIYNKDIASASPDPSLKILWEPGWKPWGFTQLKDTEWSKLGEMRDNRKSASN